MLDPDEMHECWDVTSKIRLEKCCDFHIASLCLPPSSCPSESEAQTELQSGSWLTETDVMSVCHFKLLNLGTICYVAIDNKYNLCAAPYKETRGIIYTGLYRFSHLSSAPQAIPDFIKAFVGCYVLHHYTIVTLFFISTEICQAMI